MARLGRPCTDGWGYSGARRVCRPVAESVILAGFSPNSHESRPPMEIQPILNTIKDLTERSQSIRGYL